MILQQYAQLDRTTRYFYCKALPPIFLKILPLFLEGSDFDEQNSSNDPDDRGWYNPDFFAQTTLKNDVFLIKPAPLLSSQFIFIFEHFKHLLTVEKSDFPVNFLVGGCLEIYAAWVLFRLRGSATFEKKSHMSIVSFDATPTKKARIEKLNFSLTFSQKEKNFHAECFQTFYIFWPEVTKSAMTV